VTKILLCSLSGGNSLRRDFVFFLGIIYLPRH
jgi:hypothetical protein